MTRGPCATATMTARPTAAMTAASTVTDATATDARARRTDAPSATRLRHATFTAFPAGSRACATAPRRSRGRDASLTLLNPSCYAGQPDGAAEREAMAGDRGIARILMMLPRI